MVVNLANFIEYFATPISGQVTFQRQGYESDLAFAMDAKCGMYQSSPGERTPFFGAAFCAVIGGCMSLHFRCHNICFCTTLEIWQVQLENPSNSWTEGPFFRYTNVKGKAYAYDTDQIRWGRITKLFEK